MSKHTMIEEREAAVADTLNALGIEELVSYEEAERLVHVLRALYVTAYTAGVNDMAERAHVGIKDAFEGRSA
jgi:hypothetical protein